MATTLQLLQAITSGDAGWQQARNIILNLSATVQNADPNASYLLYNGYTTADTTGLKFSARRLG